MTEWFARPVLHVSSVEASLPFYVDRLGFTVPWRVGWDGRVHVAEVDRGSCALILSDEWPEKVGKEYPNEPQTKLEGLVNLEAT